MQRVRSGPDSPHGLGVGLADTDDPVTRSYSLRDFDSYIIPCARLFNGLQFNLHGLHHDLEVSGRSDNPDPIADGELSTEFERSDTYLPEIAVDAADFLL